MPVGIEDSLRMIKGVAGLLATANNPHQIGPYCNLN